MPAPKPTAEIRLLVIATIDLANPDLAEALRAEHRQPSSVPQLVAEEVVSNLESVSYVDTAIVSQL